MTAPTVNASALEILMDMLRQWGLESLGTSVRQMLVDGDPIELVPLKLQETREYKERFAANEARRRRGLPVLSPAEYIATERQYRDRMRRYGLPPGFYDSQDDFKKFLESDMSPEELEDRVVDAQTQYLSAPVEERANWARLYGYTPDVAVASMLDPERGEIVRKRQMAAVSIASEATRAFRGGYELNAGRAEDLASKGVTGQDARRAYQDIAGRRDNDKLLGSLAGQSITDQDLEGDAFEMDAAATDKLRRARQAEQSRFDQNYLGVTPGSLGRDRSY